MQCTIVQPLGSVRLLLPKQAELIHETTNINVQYSRGTGRARPGRLLVLLVALLLGVDRLALKLETLTFPRTSRGNKVTRLLRSQL